MSLLEKLYFGEIAPYDCSIHSAEYKKLLNQLCDRMDWLQKHKPKRYNQIDHLLNLQADISSIERTHAFADGFSLGLLLCMESFGQMQ